MGTNENPDDGRETGPKQRGAIETDEPQEATSAGSFPAALERVRYEGSAGYHGSGISLRIQGPGGNARRILTLSTLMLDSRPRHSRVNQRAT